jgi:hypothetical protein
MAMKTMPMTLRFVRVDSDSGSMDQKPEVLPAWSVTQDMSLVERTIGPMEHMDRGVKWSPVREVLATHGVFHG